MTNAKPLVISCPYPRTLDLIFTTEALSRLRAEYEIVETTDEALRHLGETELARAEYIIGQPPIDDALLARLARLRAVFNVETNLLDNMPYDAVFARGIHVLTTGAVFALPVAELGVGMALDLARGIGANDADFANGREKWGGDGNQSARLLTGSEIGIIGFGDLGRALVKVLAGFDAKIRVFDPWLPSSIISEAGCEAADLPTVLSKSDTMFCVAAVTTDNAGFLDADAFATMRNGAHFILLSRAGVVDFDAMLDAVERGHIRAATDVFPQEPLPPDDRARATPGLLKSAHRAGALDLAFKRMGDMVLDDVALMDKGLPPMRCKRAERETVRRMQSKPVTQN